MRYEPPQTYQYWLPESLRRAYDTLLQQLGQQSILERFWQRDARLWHPSAETQAHIRARLGWLHLPDKLETTEQALTAWMAELRARAISHVAYAATGGANSHARLWQSLAAPRPNDPRLMILDTIDPLSVQAALRHASDRTAFVIAAAQSGPTMRALGQIVTATAREQHALPALLTPHAALLGAEAEHGRHLAAPIDVGERFGALAAWGVLPALITGADLNAVRTCASQMQAMCHNTSDLEANPGAQLGVWLAVMAQHGRDLLTIHAAAQLHPLAEWIAALLAGSLSKHGRGFVPIVGEALVPPTMYGGDRCLVLLRLANAPDPTLDHAVAALADCGQPVLVYTLPDLSAVAAQIVQWQIAVSIAAIMLGLNPFDEPDTIAMEAYIQRQLEHRVAPRISSGMPGEHAAHQLQRRLQEARWTALVPYFSLDQHSTAQIGALRHLLLTRFHLPSVVVEPYRQPYATQLLHAGRSDGLIVAFTAADTEDVAVPGMPWSLHDLCRTRAAADEYAWQRMQRQVIVYNCGADPGSAIQRLYEMF